MTVPVANQAPTFEKFANTPTPWMPDQTFWQQNAGTVQEVAQLITADHPAHAATVDFDPTGTPPKEQRVALFRFLMGAQHGKQAVESGKVDIEDARLAVYAGTLGKLAIGEQSIMEPIPVNPNVEYDQALLNCGTPEENIARLEMADKPNIKNIVALTGQRKRGMWPHIKSEKTLEGVFRATAEHTGAEMSDLAMVSPFVRSQLALTGDEAGWDGPFASEYEMFRLGVEAKFAHLIDWENYDTTVTVQAPVGPNEETHYMVGDRLITMPPREEGAVTYRLTDGRKVHVVNGAAIARPGAEPRANSTSIAQEAMNYVPVPENANVVAISAVPHFRAAMDTVITYLNEIRTGRAEGSIARADIATSKMGPNTHMVAALGELIATEKAARRLQTVLAGQDPNSAELNNF
jgi:hypothetical protein